MISVAIQCHPRRAEMAEQLAIAIGGDVDVVFDPEPDNPMPSPWRTYRHALEQTPAEASHRLIVQDDATVCDGFRTAAGAALAAQAERIVAFFVGGRPTGHARAVYEACDRDVPWANLKQFTWLPVVATAWPVDHIKALLDFVDAQRWPERFRADDEIAGRYLRHKKIFPLATVPSLVQHGDFVQSLVGKRNAAGADVGRVAACWIGDCDVCDPTLIDWTVPPLR